MRAKQVHGLWKRPLALLLSAVLVLMLLPAGTVLAEERIIKWQWDLDGPGVTIHIPENEAPPQI